MTVPLVGTEGLASVTLPDKRSLPPFSTQVMEFLADLSGALLRDSVVRQYPDLVTFAFWCRRAALEREKAKVDTSDRLGRGRVFHIAPSNVPVNFAYSLVAGLLAGNSNVVRLPSKQFGQVDVLASALERMGPQHGEIDDYITLVRYDRTDKAVTDNLSRQCDVRVIWGGDETIADVRRSPLPLGHMTSRSRTGIHCASSTQAPTWLLTMPVRSRRASTMTPTCSIRTHVQPLTL